MADETALPNDLAACHAMLAQQAEVVTMQHRELSTKDCVIEQLSQRLEEQKVEIAKLQAERDAALQLAFRKKSERYIDDPKQFVLDFGDTPDVVDAAEGIADAALETVDGYERRKIAQRKARNEQLPAHLPRYEVKLEVPEDQKTCATHGERQVIGYDWQETLEVVPLKLIVRRTGIPKLACTKAPECGIVEAPRPVGLVEGNKYDTFRCGRDHGREVCVSHTDLPPAGSLRILWLDACQRHALKCSRSGRRADSAIDSAPPGGGAGGTDHRHRRNDSDTPYKKLATTR